MSQSGFTPIQLYRSSTAAAVPLAADLAAGELAINTTDEKLYFENASGVVKLLASSAATGGTFTTVTATTVVNGLGAVGTPSYTFTGDLNTGMWSPAADTVAVSTAGAERLRISSAGDVGIGTVSPTSKLHVEGGSVRSSVSIIVSGAGSMQTAIAGSGLALNSSGANGISIETGATPTERMRITSVGDVGIGTTSPTSKLMVKRDANSTAVSDSASIVLSNRNTAISGAIMGGIFADTYRDVADPSYTGGVWFTRVQQAANLASSSEIVFGTSLSGSTALPTERMRLTTSGNLGIGTSAPSEILDIRKDTSGTQLRVSTSDNGNIFYAGWATGASYIGAAGYNSPALAFQTAGSERMRISAAGNVGIGNTAPTTALDVSGSITSRSGSVIADTLTNYGTNLVINAAGGLDTIFQTNGTERMRLVTGGNVGIGTTAPSFAKLQVGNGSAEGLEFQPAVVAGTNRILSYNRTTAGYNALRLDGEREEFYTTGIERMRIDSSGDLLLGTTVSPAETTAGQIALGPTGLMLQTGSNIAAGGTRDLTINTDSYVGEPGGFVGTLNVTVTRLNFAPQSTKTVFAVVARGTTFTFSSLATQNGSGGGMTFTLTMPSNGVVRFTDTSGSGSDVAVAMSFFGSKSTA